MINTIYSVTGCARCKITKRYMAEQGITFEEFDINKAEGKDAFSQFYRTNRRAIFRDKGGVEFPVFTDGTVIRQGVSVIIGHLIADNGLDEFISHSVLHGKWIGGFCVSGGDPARAEELIRVLSYLKQSGLKIQLTTSGKNASVLEKILAKGLGDRMIMEVKGPGVQYEQITGQAIDVQELKQSIRLAAQFDEYQFYTTIEPVRRSDRQFSYLTPEEIGQTAQMIETATSSKKHPYELRLFNPKSASNEALKSVGVLHSSVMLKYRTAARRYIVITEIEK